MATGEARIPRGRHRVGLTGLAEDSRNLNSTCRSGIAFSAEELRGRGPPGRPPLIIGGEVFAE